MTLGFVGLGRMGAAIVGGILSQPDPPTLIYSDPNVVDDRLTRVSLQDLAKQADIVVFCVKPQHIATILAEFPTCAPQGIVSLLAGTPIATFADRFPGIAICRVMPNTPACIGKGVSALSFNAVAKDSFRVFLSTIFSGIGSVVSVDESHMNTITALSGSGPAFFYRIVREFCKAGQTLGLDEATCLQLVSQTMIGAGHMIQESPHSINELIDAVSSPGGTTLAGLSQFDTTNLDTRLQAVITAAHDRAKELGG